MQSIKNLTVYGEKEVNADGSITYILEASKRDSDNRHDISLADNDKQLEFVFNDDTVWICDNETLYELYPEADMAIKTPGQRAMGSDSFELPPTLQVRGAERGIIADIAVKFLKVFAKKEINKSVGDIAKRLEDKHLKNIFPENSSLLTNGLGEKLLKDGAAIFQIDANFTFSKFDGGQPNKPYFLFIHGTNSDTYGAFNELANAPAWATLHNLYGGNVIAFQHRTLTQSPLENAVQLANMLPDNATLHIISHSRGGIVGDILSLYSSAKGVAPVGFANENIELLKKEGNRQKDIDCIKALTKIFQTKKVSVTKFIRVACPAAGTKLASKRLDHILNVFFNLFGGYANPYAALLKELLSAVVSTKDNVDVLPGVEAQSPASPFIKILNDQSNDTAIDGGPLAVISGNGKVSISGSGLMVILGRLFYWQRNDLVVNTDSMYLGAKRKNNIQYFFDQGSDVTHVTYFANIKTCEAINLALNAPEGGLIPGFKAITQNNIPGSDRDVRGFEHGELSTYEGVPSGNRPIVLLVPGIMGSNLSRKDEKVWLNYISAVFGGLIKLEYANDSSITATSVIKTSYGRLASRLSAEYDVVIYPFDWRKQLNECAKIFDLKIKELLQLGQPIKIVGHSMGGVMVRDFIINHDDTWQKLNKSKDFRLLFLGAPLGGSFRIPTVLFGQDSIISSLNMLDRIHTKKELLDMFCRFPGILSLLPLTTDTENDFAEMTTWVKMRDAQNDSTWPLPQQEDLDIFKKYRDNIIVKRDAIDYSNMIYVAGKDKQTPCAYFSDMIPPRIELTFLYTAEGDQSVTWELGIPKQLKDSGDLYYVDVTHGALANAPEIFEGIEELLSMGATTLLKKTKPEIRGEEKIFRSQYGINFDLSERGLENAILGIDDMSEPVASQVPLTVTVSNGDLRYSSFPVLAGHFANDGVLYAEKIIDNRLGGMLTSKHQLSLYPGEIGTSDVSGRNDRNDFAGAIIVGLGEAGSLTSFQLAKSVEQGVLNYLLTIKDKPVTKKGVGVSALIIGCGYGGLTIESSLKAIIEGVSNANDKIISLFKNGCKAIQHIEFVEVYAYRALNCLYALNKIAADESTSWNVVIGSKKIKELLGIRKRIPFDTSDDWWNRVNVKYKPAAQGSDDPPCMVFGVSTGDSKEEVNELYSSTPLIDLFIEEVSTKNRWSATTAKALFELMVPNELKEKLKAKGNINWILDTNTAAYPWELLQDSTTNAKPLCINAGMIRQLSTSDYRIKIKRVADDKALIVADPILNGFINQLPGAKKEGEAVEEILENTGYPVTSVIHKDAASVVRNFFSNDYKIIHLAGHGAFNAKSPKKSGMVIGKDVFLTVFDIQQMPVVPELVFVNCCHLGKVSAMDEKYYQDRYKLAANIGTELIKIGVKAVIAAGWAVDDEAALAFARIFYASIFAGYTFGDAVKDARNFIYAKYPNSNTWGAYQCYGDPFFRLKNVSHGKKTWSPSYIVPEEAEIDLDNLFNELQMGEKNIVDNLNELNIITRAIEKAGITSALVTERQALIYFEMGMYEEAVEKFKLLLDLEDAAFSFFCMEKYCNTRAKLYVRKFLGSSIFKTNAESERKQALIGMEKVINDLNILCTTGRTAERLNLLASSYKRKALLLVDKGQRINAYKAAMACYRNALDIKENSHAIYSVINAIEMECLLLLGGILKEGEVFTFDGKTYTVRLVTESKAILDTQQARIGKDEGTQDLNYWDMVADTNINLCRLLLGESQTKDGKDWDNITAGFNKTWLKAGSEEKKIAILEHFQFLHYTLLTAKNEVKITSADQIISTDKADTEELTKAIRQLHSAYNSATVTPKKSTPVKKRNNATNKAVTKKAVKKRK
ncbi:MAG: CHAT domain-containing protein [Ginsengibacter sp.]